MIYVEPHLQEKSRNWNELKSRRHHISPPNWHNCYNEWLTPNLPPCGSRAHMHLSLQSISSLKINHTCSLYMQPSSYTTFVLSNVPKTIWKFMHQILCGDMSMKVQNESIVSKATFSVLSRRFSFTGDARDKTVCCSHRTGCWWNSHQVLSTHPRTCDHLYKVVCWAH